MDKLERDALEVLSLVRSVKNSLAPVNRTPPEVLSVIPDYWDEDHLDRNLITLTHVCRSWRTVFTSHPLLWSYFQCRDIDKTRTYIERSKATPLEIDLEDSPSSSFIEEAFLLVVPHISRLKCLNIMGSDLPDVISYFSCPTPLLEELNIDFSPFVSTSVLSGHFLDGDLSSLRKLSLGGVRITFLPWKNLSNLTTFNLRYIPSDQITVTQFLNFFENSPLLHTIALEDSIPDASDAPPGRVVSLLHLKKLTITAQLAHFTLLNHLSIPSDTFVVLEFKFRGGTPIIPNYLPRPSENIKPLLCVTTISLLFDRAEKFLRLDGPGGAIYVFGHCVTGRHASPHAVDCQILHSLDQSILSATKRLAISKLRLPVLRANKCQIFQTLSSMNNLRTLTLTKCLTLPFILALNPGKTPLNLVCPKLVELTLYVKGRESFHIMEMLSMVEERALRDAKLSSITIVGLGDLLPRKEVFRLSQYVTHVDYEGHGVPPDWDRSLAK